MVLQSAKVASVGRKRRLGFGGNIAEIPSFENQRLATALGGELFRPSLAVIKTAKNANVSLFQRGVSLKGGA
jgi:hypothetical protein